MKRLILIILISICTLHSKGQNYNIKVKIDGIKDTVVYLGHHFGEKKYIVDTAKVDNKGNATFSRDRKLAKGIYLVIMPSKNMRYFEILVSDNQTFSIHTDTTDFLNSIKIKGSKENDAFIYYQKKMIELSNKMNKLNEEYALTDNEVDKKNIAEKITNINKTRLREMDKIIKDNKGTFLATLITSMLDINVPDAPKDENGDVIDPAFQYRYFRKHYFDNIDFSESGLLRSPIFESKINYYFENLLPPLADTVIPEAKMIIQKAYDGGDTLMFKYTLSHLLNRFETSKIMGFDGVFVAIAEDWYLNGKAYWADSTFLEKLNERVEKITPNKIGNIAANLTRMQTIDGKYYSLHQIEADYTILLFYEPSCGHCKKEIPALLQEYKDSLKDLGVKIFTVYTQYDKKEWEDFVAEKELQNEGWYNVWDGPYPHSNFRDFYDIYSTPVLFVLDKDKKIIGKRIAVSEIKNLIKFIKEKEKK